MNTITDFINYELYPALWNSLDRAFPSMGFVQRGGDWQSPKKLNGDTSSPYRVDKTVVTRRKPNRVLEQGGESLSLIDFYLQSTGRSTNTKGAELIEALRSLCTSIGLTLPEGDSEEFKAYKERQEKLERVASTMQRELFTPAGADTLKYLTGVRGYSVEDIKAMGLGYCSTSTAKELEGAPYGAGTTYTLAIPYRSGGRILGFKLRTVEADVKPKYKNTEGLPKKASLFGLTPLKLTGNGEKDRDITIVEGELDALRAQIRGVENIVASAGLDVSTEALEEAKRRGVKRVTILVDVEENKESQRAKLQKIEKAIRAIRKVGLTAMVAELPEGTQGEKVDVDTYLNNYTAEQLKAIIDKASTGAKYIFLRCIHEEAVEWQGGDGEIITDKCLDEYKERTIALLIDSELCPPTECNIIANLYKQSTRDVITTEALLAEADARKIIADKNRQEAETKELLKTASNLANAGRVEDSLRLLTDKATEIRKIAKEAEYSSLLSLPTVEGIKDKLRTRPQGIETNYVFSTGGREERLTLPVGALTLVAAPTSHGKSTFLRNLALQTAQDNTEGTVLYFSFEEDMESTVIELVNTYVGETLTNPSRDYNNLTTITEYYRTGSVKYMKVGVEQTFRQKEAEFMRDYIEQGKLRIFDKDFSSNELVEVINYIAKSITVKAVFIDYVQLLYRQGNRLQRNEELKEIAKDLRQTAKALKLPIILAAQLNREAKSPSEMHSQNIADSADLEREANKVLLLWNTSFKQTNGSSYNPTSIEALKRPELGTAGKIYAKLSKNRGGIPSIDALFDFDGNTGKIEPNYNEVEEYEPLAF